MFYFQFHQSCPQQAQCILLVFCCLCINDHMLLHIAIWHTMIPINTDSKSIELWYSIYFIYDHKVQGVAISSWPRTLVTLRTRSLIDFTVPFTWSADHLATLINTKKHAQLLQQTIWLLVAQNPIQTYKRKSTAGSAINVYSSSQSICDLDMLTCIAVVSIPSHLKC